jgi:hypothetical protein
MALYTKTDKSSAASGIPLLWQLAAGEGEEGQDDDDDNSKEGGEKQHTWWYRREIHHHWQVQLHQT